MENTVKKAIEKYVMLSEADKVLCGLSGGADSVAMALCLKEMGYDVIACHLNHMLRGAESDEDEAFCVRFCKNNDIKLYILRKNALEYSKCTGESLETAARNMRYQFFNETAKACGATKIATAHTANDNLETMLFNLIRGTGLKGLCGIPPIRDSIIRPLIFTERGTIERYLEGKGQDFRIDSSNHSDDYTRNAIRHNVVPELLKINPSAVKNAAGAAGLLRQDSDYLEAQSDYLETEIECEKLKAMPNAIASRVLRRMLENAGVPAGELTQRHIEKGLALSCHPSPSARLCLPGGITLYREYSKLSAKKAEETEAFDEIPVFCGQTVKIPGQNIILSIKKVENKIDFYNSFNTFYADCDTIDFETLHIRARRSGDLLAATRGGGHKTLKKLFIEKKIPKRIRESLPIIADSKGVIAVYSIGMDISRAAKPEKPAILIKFEDGET